MSDTDRDADQDEDTGRDPSMPKRMPGQGDCPAGYRPAAHPSQPGAAHECVPIGPNIPLGGWKPVPPGNGPGYPGYRAQEAFNALLRAIGG